MTKSLKPEPPNPIRLAGVLNGVKFHLGVPNPLDGLKPAPLGRRHLQALRALLGFVDPARLGDTFAISEAEFSNRFPAADAWSLLLDLLLCWVRTSTSGGTVVSHFASVAFCKREDRATALVRLSEHVIPVLKAMIRNEV